MSSQPDFWAAEHDVRRCVIDPFYVDGWFFSKVLVREADDIVGRQIIEASYVDFFILRSIGLFFPFPPLFIRWRSDSCATGGAIARDIGRKCIRSRRGALIVDTLEVMSEFQKARSAFFRRCWMSIVIDLID